jgi:hypothetical protein
MTETGTDTAGSGGPQKAFDGANPFGDILTSEPADPAEINDERREQTRLAPDWFDIERVPTPLVECGCTDCPPQCDPLADGDEGAFTDVLRDSLTAKDECPSPQPMTLERAGRAYYAYQTALYRKPNKTSALERTRGLHGRCMQAERDLLHQYDDPTTVLLSFRLSPIVDPTEADADYYDVTPTVDTSVAAKRHWQPPVLTDQQLHEALEPLIRTLRRKLLSAFDWGYCWVVSGTDSAATPHLHCLIWVDDSDNAIGTRRMKVAVETVIQGDNRFREQYHPVGDDQESDSLVIDHTLRRAGDIPEDRLIPLIKESDHERYEANTAGFYYLMNQRPHWVLRRIRDGDVSLTEQQTQTDLQAAATAWASPCNWVGYGGDFSPSE